MMFLSLQNSPISSNHQNFHQSWWQKWTKIGRNYCHQNWWHFRHSKTHRFLQFTKNVTKIDQNFGENSLENECGLPPLHIALFTNPLEKLLWARPSSERNKQNKSKCERKEGRGAQKPFFSSKNSSRDNITSSGGAKNMVINKTVLIHNHFNGPQGGWIIYLILLSDTDNLLSFWDNLLSVAIVT